MAFESPWFMDRVALEITAVIANKMIQASAIRFNSSCSSIMF